MFNVNNLYFMVRHEYIYHVQFELEYHTKDNAAV